MDNTLFIGVMRKLKRLHQLRKQRMKMQKTMRMVDGGSILMLSGGTTGIRFYQRGIKKKELKRLVLYGNTMRLVNAGDKKLVKILNS